MASLAGVVQQLRKERDQAARRSNNWTPRLPRSTATHTEDELELGARFQQQEGRGSRLRREHDGLRCERMPDRRETSYRCLRKKRCRLPLAGRLPPLNGRGGRR